MRISGDYFLFQSHKGFVFASAIALTPKRKLLEVVDRKPYCRTGHVHRHPLHQWAARRGSRNAHPQRDTPDKDSASV